MLKLHEANAVFEALRPGLPDGIEFMDGGPLVLALAPGQLLHRACYVFYLVKFPEVIDGTIDSTEEARYAACLVPLWLAAEPANLEGWIRACIKRFAAQLQTNEASTVEDGGLLEAEPWRPARE